MSKAKLAVAFVKSFTVAYRLNSPRGSILMRSLRPSFPSVARGIVLCAALTILAGAAHADFTGYSNLGTYSHINFANAGASNSNPITALLADDIHPILGSAGKRIVSFQFAVGNLNNVSFIARPRVRFYDTTGEDGLPGNYLGGYDFDPISMPASLGIISSPDISAANIVVPTTNDGSFWVGVTYDNVGGTATVSQLNKLAGSLYDAPTIGSSDYTFFKTASGGSFDSSNPEGDLYAFGGSTQGNYGWSFTIAGAVVPEVNTIALLGAGVPMIGGLVLLRRRKA